MPAQNSTPPRRYSPPDHLAQWHHGPWAWEHELAWYSQLQCQIGYKMGLPSQRHHQILQCWNTMDKPWGQCTCFYSLLIHLDGRFLRLEAVARDNFDPSWFCTRCSFVLVWLELKDQRIGEEIEGLSALFSSFRRRICSWSKRWTHPNRHFRTVLIR